jgi:hypothetical protein
MVPVCQLPFERKASEGEWRAMDMGPGFLNPEIHGLLIAMIAAAPNRTEIP